jgi:hypothetical protein
MHRRLTLGIGVSDAVEDVAISDNVHRQAHVAWSKMFVRCYDKKCHARQPTYIGCTVCAEWVYFSKFRRWFVQHYKPGYQLDKDILVPGNKVYSPRTCTMVPAYINMLLVDSRAARGPYPLGVTWATDRKKFASSCRVRGKRVNLGYFHTPEEASAAYRTYKTEVVRKIATAAYEAGEISNKVKLALCRRKF